jgi:hypothetical protein
MGRGRRDACARTAFPFEVPGRPGWQGSAERKMSVPSPSPIAVAVIGRTIPAASDRRQAHLPETLFRGTRSRG